MHHHATPCSSDGATKVLWEGGALYVPNLSWQPTEAKLLVGHLIAWHLHCDRNGQSSEQQQVYNNLRSVQLHRPAGLSWPENDTPSLLRQWSAVAGQAALRSMLEAQGAQDNPRYSVGGSPVTR